MVENNTSKRTGWVVPASSIEAIRGEDAALFKEAVLAMHDYNMTGTVDTDALSPAARILFTAFKQTMDANTRHYEERCRRNQENGKKNKGRKNKINPE